MKRDDENKASNLKPVRLKESDWNEDYMAEDEIESFEPHVDEHPEYYDDQRGALKELRIRIENCERTGP